MLNASNRLIPLFGLCIHCSIDVAASSNDGGAGGGGAATQAGARDTGGFGSSGTEPSTSTGGPGPSCFAPSFDFDETIRPHTLIVAGDNAYVATQDQPVHKVIQADLTTGASFILATPEEEVRDLAVFAGYVYIGEKTAVRRIPEGGGAAEFLADAENLSDLAVDESGVYWTESIAGGGLRYLPAGGGAVEQLPVWFELDPCYLSLSAQGVVILPYNLGPHDVTLVDASLGTSEVLATTLNLARYPFEHAGYVHWLDEPWEGAPGGISRVPSAGGAKEQVLPLEGRLPFHLSIHDGHYTIVSRIGTSDSDVLTGSLPIQDAPTLVVTATVPDYVGSAALNDALIVVAAGTNPKLRSYCRADLP